MAIICFEKYLDCYPFEGIMESKKLCSKPLIEQITSFVTFDFIIHATSILEKLFWMFICIGGTLWIGDIILTQNNYWNENPTFVTERIKELSELIAPTVTFCSNAMSQYTLLERLGNYIDPNKINSEEFNLIKREAIDAYLNSIYVEYDECGYKAIKYIKNIGDYQDNCCNNNEHCKVKYILKVYIPKGRTNLYQIINS